jgi:hypothetical protein
VIFQIWSAALCPPLLFGFGMFALYCVEQSNVNAEKKQKRRTKAPHSK